MRPDDEEEKVRRVVSVGSTVVGLLCYSCSSYFIHLFGEWNWWKILLYILFSCLVCLAVLFHKAWNMILQQHEGLPKFLVLTSTTVFLFFSDRPSNGKSDAYGVISCVAFSVMSLICRFSELLTFFTGALIVQLMGIKLFLCAVGVVLCFIFIVQAPYLQRYLVEIRGESQPYNQFQDEHQVIIDIDHDHQPEAVSYLVAPPSIVEDLVGQLLIGENDEIQEVVEVISSLESSEDQLLDQLLQVIANIATDTREYTSVLELFRIYWPRVGCLAFKYDYTFSVTSDITSTSRKEILYFNIIIRKLKLPIQDDIKEKVVTRIGGGDWIHKPRHARWPVTQSSMEDDLTTSLPNISLPSIIMPAYANFINRFHKVLARMERLTSKAQNALKQNTTIFGFIDQWPTMNVKVLKLD
ncbi:hypothetical protein S83_000628 [Arachis hypogaea]